MYMHAVRSCIVGELIMYNNACVSYCSLVFSTLFILISSPDLRLFVYYFVASLQFSKMHSYITIYK